MLTEERIMSLSKIGAFFKNKRLPNRYTIVVLLFKCVYTCISLTGELQNEETLDNSRVEKKRSVILIKWYFAEFHEGARQCKKAHKRWEHRTLLNHFIA